MIRNKTGRLLYGHFYDRGKGIEFKPCTKEEYDSLALKDAGAPNVPGKWVYSAGGMEEFDTQNGFLADGDEFIDGDKTIIVRNGKREIKE